MGWRGNPAAAPGAVDLEGALAALCADDLRRLIRDLESELGGKVHGRVVDRLVDQAARSGSGWAPPPPAGEAVAEVLAYAAAARRAGAAAPAAVEECLCRGGDPEAGRRAAPGGRGSGPNLAGARPSGVDSTGIRAKRNRGARGGGEEREEP